MKASMRIRKLKKNGIIVLTLDGDVNAHTAPKLYREFEKLYDQGIRKLVVDLKKVTYLDSSGLATLINMLQRLRQNNGAMALANMIDKVQYLFEISKIDMLMSIYQTQDDAISSL